MTEKYNGMWDFDGSCAPNEDGTDTGMFSQQTFSLGCFQWVQRKDGRGLKPGKVKWRARGRVWDPAPVYAAARAFCAKKNAE